MTQYLELNKNCYISFLPSFACFIYICFKGNSPLNDTSQGSKKKQEPRKMWVHVKATGDMLEINLDKDRPVKFDTKEQEVRLSAEFRLCDCEGK